MTDYSAFLKSKQRVIQPVGETIDLGDINPLLFPFQRDLVKWAVHKGRAAIFADTGLGKTFMQLEWARLLNRRTIILAPLAVAQQTSSEAHRLGLEVPYVRDDSETGTNRIVVTNYERLDRFHLPGFDAVVLDESSILKAFSGTIKRKLVEGFRDTQYRLACTATPAPNDIEELTNHADFLSIMKANEMRSTFFIADSRGQFMRYRLKHHAKDSFYRWLASWSAAIKKPSDLGYSDEGFNLPPLTIEHHVVASDWAPEGQLFGIGTKGVGKAAEVRNLTVDDRCDQAAAVVLAEPTEPWLIWVGTNKEADAMQERLPDAVEVRGNDSTDYKADTLYQFATGDIDTLITKAGIAGFGMNFQRCARMMFVGLGYSYEQYYQAIRRCWRFGQTRPVVAHVVVSEPEQDILEVIEKKESQARNLSDGLIRGMVEHTRAEIFDTTSAADSYEPTTPVEVPSWI